MERGALIDSRLDHATDGTGGGYGKYTGLTVAAIAERFRYLAEEGQGRSARAILRMVHEQTEARGGLGTQRLLAGLALIVTVVLFVCRAFVADDAKSKLTLFLFVSGGITALFVAGAASVHRATVRGEAQILEIRRLALLALDLLVTKEGFTPKPLEREHERSLSELRKTDPEAWRRVDEALRKGGGGS